MKNESTQGKTSTGLVVLIVIIGVIILFTMMGGQLTVMRQLGLGRPFGFPALFPFGFVGIWGILQIVLAVWVGLDANKKGQSGLLWGLLVLFTSVIGLVVYLIVSPNLAARNGGTANRSAAVETTGRLRCPSCESPVQSDFKVCPACGGALPRCRQCERAVQTDWKVCPYCGSTLAG